MGLYERARPVIRVKKRVYYAYQSNALDAKGRGFFS
jgi:hypothetical protein